MSTIIFECDVTEFDVIPTSDHDEVSFLINKESLVINIKDNESEEIIFQTEINRESAIELAKLILFKYQ